MSRPDKGFRFVAGCYWGGQHDPPSAARAASVEVHSNGFVTLPRSWTRERMLDGSDFFRRVATLAPDT